MPQTMRAMIFDGSSPLLHPRDVPVPEPGPGELRIAASTCVCAPTCTWWTATCRTPSRH